MKQVKSYTHHELVDIAHGYVLRNMGCGVAYKEVYCAGNERPDVIAFSGWHSVLIECKISRQDFLQDKKKPCRQDKGMGKYRYYCCPTGLIKVEELPENWGLIYVNQKGRTKLIHRPDNYNRIWADSGFERDLLAELRLLYSILRRAEEQKLIPNLFKPINKIA